MAANSIEVPPPADFVVGDFHFYVFTFVHHEGDRAAQARVYTTVRNGQMLSIAFAANNTERMEAIVASMKTFTPIAGKS